VRYPDHLDVFFGNELSQYLLQNTQRVRNRIEQEKENYILNVSETSYIEFLSQEHQVEGLTIFFDNVSVSSREEHIPADQFPSGFYVRQGKSYPRQVVTYHIPYTGNRSLFRFRPSQSIGWTTKVLVTDDEIRMDAVVFYDGEEGATRVKSQMDYHIGAMTQQYSFIVEEIERYNQGLLEVISELFHGRKDRVLKQRNVLASLGVPVKTRTDVSSTFAIPTPNVRKTINIIPVVAEQGFVPEPTLAQEVYEDILRAVYDVGRLMERSPTIYQGKGEEALRDLCLMFLEPRFEGSATGETFNKSGKTDILIRFQNANVFIAECKFWGGVELYLKTISQLLKYLTWRDSKAAVILFVKNREFSSVIAKVREETLRHAEFLGFAGQGDQDGTWLNYRFHLPGDTNREVRLAILLLHLPPQ
jgi:hypothetical protein